VEGNTKDWIMSKVPDEGCSLFARGVHLDTVQLPIATHSDRCLEIFHCSSTMNDSCPIKPCPIEHHPLASTVAIYILIIYIIRYMYFDAT